MTVTPSDEVIGHVLCTRGHVGPVPVLALGPLTVRPGPQRQGVGGALMHAVLGAADALGEPLVALLGDPAYYGRFGFRPGSDYQITPPKPEWGPTSRSASCTATGPRYMGPSSTPSRLTVPDAR